MDQMEQLGDILSETQLATLRGRGGYDRTVMKGILIGTLPKLYAAAGEYMTAIGDSLYGSLPDDSAPDPRPMLTVQDRERCLVAILASRGATLALAIHEYIALMEGVSAEEIGHILLLTGIYTGADRLAEGLLVTNTLLTKLRDQVTPTDPETGKPKPVDASTDTIYKLLRSTFPA